MAEQWRKYLDKDGENGALLKDLSKAFECLLHDLLIATLQPMVSIMNPYP